MLPFIYFFWDIRPEAFIPWNIFLFFLVIIFSIIANILIFYSTKWEKLNNIEPAKLLEPILVILLAVLLSFFAEEMYDRNIKIIIPAIIAGMAIIFSHIKRHHLTFNKYFIAAIAGSFFFALELVISRAILDFYSPITFYFIRCAVILLISLVIFKPDFRKINTRVRIEIMVTGIIWIIYRIILYYGYLNLGVIFTTLLVMLSPVFIYAFAHIFLKEKLSWRNIISSIIIVVCILYVIV